MSSAKIHFIDSNAFKELVELEELYLSDNEIKVMEESSFENLKNLVSLYLNGNFLTQIPPYIFKNLKSLRNISLETNSIEELSPFLFYNNPNVENIWLRDNKIAILEPKTFKNLKKLHFIDLQGNLCIKSVYYGNFIKEYLFQDLERNCVKRNIILEKGLRRPDIKPSITRNHEEFSNLNENNSGFSCHSSENLKSSRICKVNIENEINYFTEIKLLPDFQVNTVIFDNHLNMVDFPKDLEKVSQQLTKISAKNVSISSVNPRALEKLKYLKGN